MGPKYLMAIEIGSSKIKGSIGAVDQSGTLNVLAIEEEPLVDAVRYGCIQNVDEVQNHVGRIIRKLENNSAISPRKVKGAYVALGGRSLKASTYPVERQLQDGRGVSEKDIENIKNEARSANFTENDIIEVIPQDFRVDNMETQNPIGAFGQSIHATLNLITCKQQIKKNIAYAFNNKWQIFGYIVRPIAQASMVLSEDERSLGCMLVDFGAETTTVSIYKGGCLRYLATLPMGSRNITRDLMTLNITEQKAENIKMTLGNVNPQDFNTRAKQFDDAYYSMAEVNNYVVARTDEIIANVIEQIKYADYKAEELPSGIIVVGGGAKLKGFVSLLEKQSGMNVKAGAISNNIKKSDRINPIDAVDVVSILNAAAKLPNAADCLVAPKAQRQESKAEDSAMNDAPAENNKKKGSRIKGWLSNLGEFFSENDEE